MIIFPSNRTSNEHVCFAFQKPQHHISNEISHIPIALASRKLSLYEYSERKCRLKLWNVMLFNKRAIKCSQQVYAEFFYLALVSNRFQRTKSYYLYFAKIFVFLSYFLHSHSHILLYYNIYYYFPFLEKTLQDNTKARRLTWFGEWWTIWI